MAKFRVHEPWYDVNGHVHFPTDVLSEKMVDVLDEEGNPTGEQVNKVLQRIQVTMQASDINSISGTKAARITQYKNLFKQDPRIDNILDGESAEDKIEADVNFPVTVDL